MQSYSVKPHLCNRVEDLIPETANNLTVDTGYLQRHERKKERNRIHDSTTWLFENYQPTANYLTMNTYLSKATTYTIPNHFRSGKYKVNLYLIARAGLSIT